MWRRWQCGWPLSLISKISVNSYTSRRNPSWIQRHAVLSSLTLPCKTNQGILDGHRQCYSWQLSLKLGVDNFGVRQFETSTLPHPLRCSSYSSSFWIFRVLASNTLHLKTSTPGSLRKWCAQPLWVQQNSLSLSASRATSHLWCSLPWNSYQIPWPTTASWGLRSPSPRHQLPILPTEFHRSWATSHKLPRIHRLLAHCPLQSRPGHQTCFPRTWRFWNSLIVLYHPGAERRGRRTSDVLVERLSISHLG